MMENLESNWNGIIYRGKKIKVEKKKRSRSAESFKKTRKGRRNKEDQSI